MRLYLRRKFSASHRLVLPYASKCENLHGHTWLAEVWIDGAVNPTTGMVIDFHDVKEAIDNLDHRHLNNVVGLEQPTAENIVEFLLRTIPNATKVRVWESDDTYAEDVACPRI